jgi:hypothetical protein
MKKLLATLAVLVLLAVPVFPGNNANNASELITLDTLFYEAIADTILAANDSFTVMAATAKIKGYSVNTPGDWYLQIGRLTGTSKDTANLCVAVDAYSFNDTLIGRCRSDTSADRSETYTFKLPIGAGDATGGDRFYGNKYRVKIMNVGTGTTTEQTIINYVRMFLVKPFQRTTLVRQ